jgi:hypothetical protein
MAESKKRPPECPKCGSKDIVRSEHASLWVALRVMFGRWPFRCRSCRARFYRNEAPPETAQPDQ